MWVPMMTIYTRLYAKMLCNKSAKNCYGPTDCRPFAGTKTNHRKTRINNVDNRLSAVEQHIDFFVKATQLPSGGVLAPNTRFDGYELIADLVASPLEGVEGSNQGKR